MALIWIELLDGLVSSAYIFLALTLREFSRGWFHYVGEARRRHLFVVCVCGIRVFVVFYARSGPGQFEKGLSKLGLGSDVRNVVLWLRP